MIRSELADDLGVTPSVVRKWLLTYSSLTGQPLETRLDEQTVSDMQRARELTREQPGMTFREALERVLGQYTEPVPAASVLQLLDRLDKLDNTLARAEERQSELQANQKAMTDKLEAIATYLRKLLPRMAQRGEANASTFSASEATAEEER